LGSYSASHCNFLIDYFNKKKCFSLFSPICIVILHPQKIALSLLSHSVVLISQPQRRRRQERERRWRERERERRVYGRKKNKIDRRNRKKMEKRERERGRRRQR
jgi:hypothetical protein